MKSQIPGPRRILVLRAVTPPLLGLFALVVGEILIGVICVVIGLLYLGAAARRSAAVSASQVVWRLTVPLGKQDALTVTETSLRGLGCELRARSPGTGEMVFTAPARALWFDMGLRVTEEDATHVSIAVGPGLAPDRAWHASRSGFGVSRRFVRRLARDIGSSVAGRAVVGDWSVVRPGEVVSLEYAAVPPAKSSVPERAQWWLFAAVFLAGFVALRLVLPESVPQPFVPLVGAGIIALTVTKGAVWVLDRRRQR